MYLRRSRIIIVAIIFGVFGALIPVVAMSVIAWHIVRQDEYALLNRIADTTLERASRTFYMAGQSLERVHRSTLPPCSSPQISLMRDEAINSPVVEEIGYFSEGHLQCTSWGPTSERVVRKAANFLTPDGLSVTLRLKPSASISGEMAAVYRGDFGALINPSRLVDVAVDTTTIVALLTKQGEIISDLNMPDTSIVRRLADAGNTGSADDMIFSVRKIDNMTAVVINSQPSHVLPGSFEVYVILLVGFILGGAFAGIVYLYARQRLSPETELALAIKNNQIFVQYQPIIELQSGICIGAEALVRWKKADGTIVPPDSFISLAEDNGLIAQLTDKVVENVILELHSVFLSDRTLHVAINISASDMQSGRIIDFLEHRLSSTGIRTTQIWLEATERSFIDIRSAKMTLARARTMGFSIAIDDFGTGYSSLQYLQGLPLDALKIDKSFVDKIGKDTPTSAVTLHIIQMAKELDLFTVAEGVETSEQAELLKAYGVDFAQGWLYSKPLSAPQFIAFHKQRVSCYGRAQEIIQAKIIA